MILGERKGAFGFPGEGLVSIYGGVIDLLVRYLLKLLNLPKV